MSIGLHNCHVMPFHVDLFSFLCFFATLFHLNVMCCVETILDLTCKLWDGHSLTVSWTSLSMAIFVLCLCFSAVSWVTISISLMMQRHYRCSLLAAFHITMLMCLVCFVGCCFSLCVCVVWFLLLVVYPFGIMMAPLDCVLVQQHGLF